MTTPVPPQNLEAEESVVGAMLLAPNAIVAVQETGLIAHDFYRSSHGLIYTAACEMHDRGDPVDAISMVAELERRDWLKDAGGKNRVFELASLVPATSNAPHYADLVREAAADRRLIHAGSEIVRVGADRHGSVEERMEKAETLLTGAVAPTITTQFESASVTVAEVVAEIEEAITSGKPKFGLQTGFVDLDRSLTGLHPGQLILIAARPAMGKSALALNIAENIADRMQRAAGYVSLEMSREELAIRSISRESGIDSKQLRTGKVKPEDVEKFRRAATTVKSRTHLYIEDRGDTTIQQMRAEARRLKRQKGLVVLVVDYLQLMLSSKSEDNRQNEVAQLSRSLKLLARELEIPVIALSQLNRQLEGRDDKRPRLSDLRDSGSLEQDADVVLFVYRDEMYNPDSTRQGEADIIIGKNRNGETGTISLAFVGKTTTFKNLARGLEKAA